MGLENCVSLPSLSPYKVEIVTVHFVRQIGRTEEYRIYLDENLETAPFIDLRSDGKEFISGLKKGDKFIAISRGVFCLAAYGPIEENKLYNSKLR